MQIIYYQFSEQLHAMKIPVGFKHFGLDFARFWHRNSAPWWQPYRGVFRKMLQLIIYMNVLGKLSYTTINIAPTEHFSNKYEKWDPVQIVFTVPHTILGQSTSFFFTDDSYVMIIDMIIIILSFSCLNFNACLKRIYRLLTLTVSFQFHLKNGKLSVWLFAF